MRKHTIIVALVILVTVSLPVVLLFMASGGRGVAADRLKRIHELEVRAAELSAQLVQKDAQRESQRALYIERIRKGEARVREHMLEIRALRGRSDVTRTARD